MKQPRAQIHDCGDNVPHHTAARHYDRFARLLRAEFTKFRTVRAWMITICATVVVFVLLSFLSAFESRAPLGAVPVGPGGEAVSDTYMFVHQVLAGDGTLTARVTSFSGAFTSPSPPRAAPSASHRRTGRARNWSLGWRRGPRRESSSNRTRTREPPMRP